jgi:hypothetical protein
MNRRKFLTAMAAGAIITAEGLWIPGQKLISIPSGRVFSDKVLFIESWTALPDGRWLKRLTNEERVILAEEWSFCPYKFTQNPGVTTISQEFWLPTTDGVWG